jgi:hypothetical protein
MVVSGCMGYRPVPAAASLVRHAQKCRIGSKGITPHFSVWRETRSAWVGTHPVLGGYRHQREGLQVLLLLCSRNEERKGQNVSGFILAGQRIV